ncbi:hypothetical protein [Microbacterium sp. CH-015]|uniref:hypothetical protein n=1 Tax=Microbacterium sp. CH-015 TaxID=3406734 RepID=UPI003C7926BE
MPTTNLRKHTIPTGSEASFTRETLFKLFGESIHDIVTVANTTARSQLVSAMVAAGKGPSTTNPLVVFRVDAPGLHRLEYTTDGTVWITAGGPLEFADLAAASSWATANPGLLATGDRCVAGGVEYRWRGAWVSASGVMVPTEVTGAGVSIGSVGQIILTNVAASTTLQIRGVFSSAFRNYRAVAQFTSKPSAAATVQGIVGSTPAGGTSYSFSRQAYVGGSRGDAQGTGQANFAEGFIPVLGTLGGGVADILAPNAPEPTYMLAQHNHLGGFAGITNLASGLNSTDQLTGLQIVSAAGGTTSGEIRIYGVS